MSQMIFFGCLDANEGADMENPDILDISIGRLPAADATEAQGMVDRSNYTSHLHLWSHGEMWSR
jgi:hypothetical protein